MLNRQSASSEKIKVLAPPILRLRNLADGSTATQSQNGGNFMARTLISKRGAISIALAILAAGTLLWIASARTIGNAAKDTAQWDEKSSKELMMALHHNHDVANTGDFKALKDSYIGDNALVTFELDPDNATPVALRSKKEIDAHIDRVSAGNNAEGTLFLDGPKMNCKATP